jgi:hypothetical protein
LVAVAGVAFSSGALAVGWSVGLFSFLQAVIDQHNRAKNTQFFIAICIKLGVWM